MTYLKDQLTGACRQFDEDKPKDRLKIERFKMAKLYNYNDKSKGAIASPGRWQVTTKAEFTKWVKKGKPIDVESTEVEQG